MKLFEIPVYALSKKRLSERVEYWDKKLREWSNSTSEEHLRKLVAFDTYPQCLWDYNHIIGVMVVNVNGDDVEIQWYAHVPKPRYYWHSDRKIFFQNTNKTGYHFRYLGLTNGKIKERLCSLVYGFVKELSKERYYADLEVFNNVVHCLDFNKCFREIAISSEQ